MKKTLTINQIFGGISAAQYFQGEGEYNCSIAVDPDLPIVSTDIRTSGFPVPAGYAKFSGAEVNTAPVAIINNPKNTLTYVITAGGKLISYTSSLGTETAIGTVTGSTASGGFYYNNYIYILGTNSGVDIARYGPLNNSPSLTNAVWTGATLGSQTALTNTTYPTLRSVSIPNHIGIVHGDNSAYVTDFKNGQGLIHRINTKKVTDEGDTNGTTVPTLYNALDLPFGFYPTSMCSYGRNILILGIYSTDATINQGKSAFVIWDPTDTATFLMGPVYLSDPLATACLNVDGIPWIWSGNGQNGVRVSKYLGGESTSQVAFQEEGLPPFHSAVDALGNRVVWGGFATSPAAGAVVWAYGSKDARLPSGLHCIAKGSGAGTTPIVTSLKYVQQSSNVTPKVVIASKDGSGVQVDQYSTTATLASNIRWFFNIGTKFSVQKLVIPLGGAVAANTTITPTLYFDDLSSNVALTAITNGNYPSKRKVRYKGTELKNCIGQNNFVLEITNTGTNPLPPALPITIELDIWADEPT